MYSSSSTVAPVKQAEKLARLPASLKIRPFLAWFAKHERCYGDQIVGGRESSAKLQGCYGTCIRDGVSVLQSHAY